MAVLTLFRPTIPRTQRRRATFVCLCTIFLGGCQASNHAASAQQHALAALGQQIFHDARFSADGKVSCATCHDPQRYFTDGKAVSTGVFGRQGTRNAPTLLNVGRVRDLFWDGRETQLEAVVLQPFTNPQEMGLPDLRPVQQYMESSQAYQTALSRAFPRGQRVASPENIAQALAAFLRGLNHPASDVNNTVAATAITSSTELGQSTNSPGVASDASAMADAGRVLFAGKAGCANCHLLDDSKPHTTDGVFHHAGIGFGKVAGQVHYANEQLKRYDAEKLPLGLVVLRDAKTAELGRFVKTRKAKDIGAFRTPSLRHVAHTAPYMHDGSVPTLQTAIERELYYRGLAEGKPIVLTTQEQQALQSFLTTL